MKIKSQFTIKNQQQVQTPPSLVSRVPECESAAVKVLNQEEKKGAGKSEGVGWAVIPESRGLK